MNSAFVDIHTHKIYSTSNVVAIVSYMAKDVADQIPQASYFSVGIHPWDISESEMHLKTIEQLARKKLIVAVGECGLDKLSSHSMEEQVDVFKKQTTIARRFKLPVVIHCVRSYDIMLSVKRSWQSLPTIIHGFRGKEQLAKQLLACGAYLSFGEALFSQTSIQKLVMSIPINRLFLETDEGETSIEDLYQLVANLRGMKVIELKELLYDNYKRVYCSPLL